MNEIDWSKAPEWANVLLEHECVNGRHCWAESFNYFAKAKNAASGVEFTLDVRMWRLVSERPSPAWSGEGLPPVGSECEFKSPSSGGWSKARIVFVSGWTIVLYVFFEHDEHCYSVSAFEKGNLKFRPIRTPEQIAADERKAGILEMIDVFGLDTSIWGLDAVREICAFLHDAGYRKP